MNLDALLRVVEKLAAKVADMVGLRWGLVTQAVPLRVQLDVDTAPLDGTPSSLVSGLAVGDRVLVAMQSRRATVLGRAGGELRLPDPQSVKLSAGASITAAVGVWQDVPGLAKITVVNPTTKRLICRVDFGATGNASAGYARVGVACSGATVVDADQFSNGIAGGGGPHAPFANGANSNIVGWKLVTLEPGTTVFTLRSMRDQTGTHSTNYPGFTVTPISFKGAS
ncbi:MULTISPECIES: hypothetical protein [unclassified Leucobacter]|uniref:hypothetical protein n=1 Tax=unclassified Leucobacter TaxID=2621730 RepID=UPI00069CB036|nr:hypothetical protein [Leucobacter sp. Ag1]